ncbi:MAG: DUF1292 domain-containing protein [Oscillospiraceae bacterium]|nr:DUF1292 domain-containing protein [Oscillospiraceae bacterium]
MSSEETSPVFISLTDDEGNDIELEFVDVLEHKGTVYRAFFPAVRDDEDAADDEDGLVILKEIVENGEELLSTLDTDEELNEVYQLFMDLLFDEEND